MFQSRLTLLLSVGLAATHFASYAVTAIYTCDNTTFAPYYPFCVNVPDHLPQDNCGAKLPTLVYLAGSGTFKDNPTQSELESQTTFDGVGSLLNRYRNGNHSQVTSIATHRFITILPISPFTDPKNASQPVKHYFPDYIDKILDYVVDTYPVDTNRLHCFGYSAGSRGCWRYTVNRPGIMASSVNSAGGAEKAGSQYLLIQPAPPTFPLLFNDVDLPIMAFDGSIDTTAGTQIPEETQEQLIKDKSTSSSLTTFPVDHVGMQSAPLTVGLFEWILKQKKNKYKTCSPALSPSSAHHKRRHHRSFGIGKSF